MDSDRYTTPPVLGLASGAGSSSASRAVRCGLILHTVDVVDLKREKKLLFFCRRDDLDRSTCATVKAAT
jgi:hypothetical protein